MPPPAIPRATYRLQLHQGFTLADAEAVVPYLSGLGVSHLYLSPIFTARPGSTHGYDIVDHGQVNPELGGRAALDSLGRCLAAHGMGLVADTVPNHMGIGEADNAWWLDVLEWGGDSPYARFFDIDWNPPRRELKGKVLQPFLGDYYGAVLERGELVPRFDRDSGAIDVWYWRHRYPVAVADYAELLRAALPPGGGGDPLLEMVLEFRTLFAGRGGRGAATIRMRARQAMARLAGLAAERPDLADGIDRSLAALAADPARLHALLERQHYRLSFWRVAADEINYRRFFHVNDLAALRMVEEPELFDRAHRLILDLIRAGLVQGLRIDHVDGLFNPAEYCRQLQARAGAALGRPGEDQPLPLWVEKILARHEPLRRDWPVCGTTGYEFASLVCGLFVDAQAEAALTSTYGRFIGETMDYDSQVVDAKKRVIDQHMTAELRVLAGRLGRVAAVHWRSRDFTLSVLVGALREVAAWLPVYRTYVTSRRVTDTDRRYIEWALAKARRASPLDDRVFDFVGAVLDTRLARDGAYSRRAVVDFAMRFQQFTGPVTAKGVEDTALYRFNRLIALNEVGGDPLRFGVSVAAFHQANRARARSHPQTLLATATHDTKRGEDTRARIAVLSELPEEWRQHLERWGQLNQPFHRQLDGGPAPEPNDEIWIYQTMLGAWPDEAAPAFVERLAEGAVKAVREASRRTAWTSPDQAYEQAVADFVRRIAETGRRNPFLDDFLGLRRRVVAVGQLNGLVQALLKLTAPGVPDLYQGSELWDLSLVDPDNRRPVDFLRRRRLLDRFARGPLPAETELWRDGAIKQAVIRRTLDLRRRRPQIFTEGVYRPLAVRGPRAAHVVAFARGLGDAQVVVVAPLLTARLWPDGLALPPLGAVWRGCHVEAPRRGAAAGRFRDLLGDRPVETVNRRGAQVLPLADLFSSFPLALLEIEDGE